MVSESTPTCNSRILIDWLSLTLSLRGEGAPQTKSELQDDLRSTWECYFAEDADFRSVPGPGRAGYHLSITDERHRITMYARLSDPDVLVEISGRGCEFLRERATMLGMLRLHQQTGTRLDIAIDFETEVTPAQFAATVSNLRIKTRTTIISPTGETEYLGSRKSDRYCRVYRYASPHPRSNYLRLELVLRAELAREAAKSILTAGLQEAADRCAASYAFTHPIYPHLGATPIADHRPETEMSTTLRWFYVQVCPAIRKMLENEILTWEGIYDAVCGN